jgi:hypothetical protein
LSNQAKFDEDVTWTYFVPKQGDMLEGKLAEENEYDILSKVKPLMKWTPIKVRSECVHEGQP